MRQIRDVIWERQYEEEQHRLAVEETKLQYLVGAVHAAAGNKDGVKMSRRIRLRAGKAKPMSRADQVRRMFPTDPSSLIPVRGL
jgi:hypothetical protein